MNRLKATNPSTGWALFDTTSVLALLTAAGVWIASSGHQPAPAMAHASDTSNLGVGIKKAKYQFTQQDVAPIVAAMSNAGIVNFVCWIDPDTGALDVVTAVDHKPHLDLLPGKCPNNFDVNGHGDCSAAMLVTTVSVGLLGNAFDVTQIDIPSVRMSPVILQENAPVELSPIHSQLKDVGAPFDSESCQCAATQPDGILDLAMKFDKDEMIDGFELDSLPNHTLFPLKVTGMIKDGRGIFGTRDCLRIINDHGNHH